MPAINVMAVMVDLMEMKRSNASVNDTKHVAVLIVSRSSAGDLVWEARLLPCDVLPLLGPDRHASVRSLLSRDHNIQAATCACACDRRCCAAGWLAFLPVINGAYLVRIDHRPYQYWLIPPFTASPLAEPWLHCRLRGIWQTRRHQFAESKLPSLSRNSRPSFSSICLNVLTRKTVKWRSFTRTISARPHGPVLASFKASGRHRRPAFTTS